MNDSKPFKLGIIAFENLRQQFMIDSCKYLQITEKAKHDEWVRGFEHAFREYLKDLMKE